MIFQSSLNNVNGTPIGLTINNGSFLKANGSVKQPIYFTSDRPVPGQWKGIRFADTNDINNILNYVTVEYAGTVDQNGNIIISGNSSVFIENSIITDSASDGISVSTSTGAVLNGIKTTNVFLDISSGTNISYQ